jgi:hypothetical protein
MMYRRPDATFWHNEPTRAWPVVSHQQSFDLRGLLVCDWCHGEMHPIVHADIRYYACLCREPVYAVMLERQVWSRFTQGSLSYTRADVPSGRREAIRQVVRRIRLGLSPYQLRFEWQD